MIDVYIHLFATRVWAIAVMELATVNSFCRHIGADFNGRFLPILA